MKLKFPQLQGESETTTFSLNWLTSEVLDQMLNSEINYISTRTAYPTFPSEQKHTKIRMTVLCSTENRPLNGQAQIGDIPKPGWSFIIKAKSTEQHCLATSKNTITLKGKCYPPSNTTDPITNIFFILPPIFRILYICKYIKFSKFLILLQCFPLKLKHKIQWMLGNYNYT